MKNFEIYVQNDDMKNGAYEKLEDTSISVDLDSLEKHYRGKGAAMAKAFDALLDFWESPECTDLLQPRGAIAFVRTKQLVESNRDRIDSGTDTDFKENLQSSPVTALMAWTTGDAIDKQIIEFINRQERLLGLLVDVAASLLLNEMHVHLRKMVKKLSESRFGLYPMVENYPGVGGRGSDLIATVFEITSLGNISGINASEHRVMHPRKSGCSIILLGDEEKDLQNMRCTPCKGIKCLYFQLGGCHVADRVNQNPED